MSDEFAPMDFPDVADEVAAILGTRFSYPRWSRGVLFCYAAAEDRELHLEWDAVVQELDAGTLAAWLKSIVPPKE